MNPKTRSTLFQVIALIILIVIAALLFGLRKSNVPVKPVFEVPTTTEPATPTITSINPISAKVGDVIDINGTDFAGFEGDKNAWIMNLDLGIKGIIYGIQPDSTNNLIRFKLESRYCRQDNSYSGEECNDYMNIIPGEYMIYVNPWGKTSNLVKLTVY